MLKAIHAQESRAAAEQKAGAIIEDLRASKMAKAADLVEQSAHETLTYYAFPDIHWQKIRTNNPLERIMREIRRRTRVVGAFPDGQSCLNLAVARLRYIAGTAWSTKRYMNMRPLYQPQVMQTGAVACSSRRSTPPTAPAPAPSSPDPAFGNKESAAPAGRSADRPGACRRGAAPPMDKEYQPVSPKCQSERAAETEPSTLAGFQLGRFAKSSMAAVNVFARISRIASGCFVSQNKRIADLTSDQSKDTLKSLVLSELVPKRGKWMWTCSPSFLAAL